VHRSDDRNNYNNNNNNNNTTTTSNNNNNKYNDDYDTFSALVTKLKYYNITALKPFGVIIMILYIIIKIRAPVIVSRLSPVGVGGGGGGGEQEIWVRVGSRLRAPPRPPPLDHRVLLYALDAVSVPCTVVASSRHASRQMPSCRVRIYGRTLSPVRGHQACRRRRAEEDHDDARVPGSTAFSWRRRTTVFTIRLPDKPVWLFGVSFRAIGAAQNVYIN